MKALGMALRWLLVGARTGARIVLDGITPALEVYDTAGTLFITINPTDGVYVGEPGRDAIAINVPASDPVLTFRDSDPSTTQHGAIRHTTLGAAAPALRLEPGIRNAGDRVQLDLVAENEAGTARPYIALGRAAPGGGYQLRAGNGTDQVCGVATLVAGTVTVNNVNIAATTLVFVSRLTAGGVLGHLSVVRTAGASFTVNSTSGTDTSTVAYLLIEPI